MRTGAGTRDGFDGAAAVTRSLLGDLGWAQAANLVISGVPHPDVHRWGQTARAT